MPDLLISIKKYTEVLAFAIEQEKKSFKNWTWANNCHYSYDMIVYVQNKSTDKLLVNLTRSKCKNYISVYYLWKIIVKSLSDSFAITLKTPNI